MDCVVSEDFVVAILVYWLLTVLSVSTIDCMVAADFCSYCN